MTPGIKELGELIQPAPLVRAGGQQYPILSMTMRHGLVDQQDKFKKRVASLDTSPYKVVTKGQLVVGFPIDEGVLSFQNLYDYAIVSPAYEIWELTDPLSVHRSYLERYLRSPLALSYYASKLQGTTARRRNLPRDIFLKMPVLLPRYSQQARVADILDRADLQRSKRRKAIGLLDDLGQSILLDMFGDPRTNPEGFVKQQLSELIGPAERINYGVVQPGNDFAGGRPLVRVGDLVAGRVTHASLKLIDPVIESKYQRSRLKGNEILVGCVGSIGLVALATPAESGFNIARAIARIPIDSDVDRRYIAEYLKTAAVQNYFVRELRTVAQPTLNIKQLAETIVLWPPEGLRAQFVTQLSLVDSLRERNLTHMKHLDGFFASLQHSAFRGEL